MVNSLDKIENVNKIYGKFLVGNLYKKRIDKVINLTDIRNKKILDIGFGYGILLLMLKDKGSELYGINIDKNQLDITKEILEKEGIDNLYLSLADITQKTYFNKDFFDVIFANSVLEHIKDIDSANLEIKRILNDNGLYIISIPTENLIYCLGRLLFGFKKPPDHINNLKDIEHNLNKHFIILKSISYPSKILPIYKLVMCKK